MKKHIANYMNTKPICMASSSSIEKVMQKMKAESTSHVLLLNENQKLEGIISKTDLLSALKLLNAHSSGKVYSQKIMASTLAANIMSTELSTLKPKDDLSVAIDLLVEQNFHCLPVVEDGIVVGILTANDLLKALSTEANSI